jgi:hypothetical protein
MRNPFKKRHEITLLPLTGQYKYDPVTLKVYLVASNATESPQVLKQVSWLDWLEGR